MKAVPPAVLERLERLLAPIPGADPCGESLRYEGTYDALVEARREDDPSLPQGVWQAPLKVADWSRVVELAGEALEQRTKDLQIAAWLVEGLYQRHGLPVLAPALGLLHGLIERYWDGLHPRIEGGDVESRVAPLDWLDDRLARRLHELPLSAPMSGLDRAWTLGEWRRREHERGGRGGAEAGAEAGATESPSRSVELTPATFYGELSELVAQAERAALRVVDALEPRAGAVTPRFRGLRERFEEVRSALRVLRPELMQESAVAPAQVGRGEAAEMGDGESPGGALTGATGGGDESQAESTAKSSASGPIRSRADAYRRLEEIALYLRRIEPHSPVPYLLGRAVAWGRMPLGDVLKDLMRDSPDLARINETLRIWGSDEP